MEGDMIGAFQAEYEEAMLNLEAEPRRPRRRREFTAAQSAWRKDVECAFGVLKARFNILAVPGRSYSRRTLGLIMRACVILHNMIIDDERDTNLENIYETVDSNVGPTIHNNAPPSLAAMIQMDNEMRDSPMYT
ncbi:uncharacterized protein [Lolium perenne]|uniref:uncharacterized protein n=1 Tax=Lolium perenne TaxID=4522 RepID=UPI003A98D9C3